MAVRDNLQFIKEQIPSQVKLVAVSKFHPVAALREAYDAGQRIFGESRVQELLSKVDQLPSEVEWHFIGHLQTNKVKNIVPVVSMIHAVDSERLLLEIDNCARKVNRTIRCLLQIHIAQEETKFGFSFQDCKELLTKTDLKKLTNVNIVGLMGMATLTDDVSVIAKEFRSLKLFKDELKSEFFAADSSFCELSMGMSDDYKVAIAEGSTYVRIGSTIFGMREY